MVRAGRKRKRYPLELDNPGSLLVSRDDHVTGIAERDVFGADGRSIHLTYTNVPVFENGATEPTGTKLRLSAVSGPGGIAVSFAYDDLAQLVTTTRANRVETYTYAAPEAAMVLTGASMQSGTGDPAQTFGYTYHLPSELTLADTLYGERLTAERIVKTVTLPDAALSEVAFVYDFGNNNQRTVTDARGNATTHTLDDVSRPILVEAPLNQTTQLAWDLGSGWIGSRTENLGTQNRLTSFSYVFDAQSRLVSTTETGPLANTRVTEFDTRFNRPTSRQDRNGFTERWLYDDHGNPSSYTDAANQGWVFTYDGQNLLSERKAPGHQNSMRFEYDAHGYVASSTSPLGFVTETSFDERGRLMARTDANRRVTNFTYDVLDNLSLVERPALSIVPSARAEALVNRSALLRTTQTTAWDALGRKVTETDQNGLSLSYQYDGRGLVMNVTRSIDGASQAFTYDDNGNLLTETDWKAQTTTHAYDALNRRDTTTHREGDVMTFAYNPVGDMLESVDYAGVVTTHVYDVLSRRTSMEVVGRGTDGAKVDWTYFGEADASRNIETVTIDRAPLAASVTTFEINARYQPLRRINPVNDSFTWVSPGRDATAADRRSGVGHAA